MTVKERVAALREVLQREKLGAFIFPSTDPHNGEYIPEHWEGRKWISGFSGSAGTAVVTMTGAALWTDSRYFIAAAEELKGTEFQLMKLKIEGTPTIAEWIQAQLELSNMNSTEIGVDGMVMATAEVEDLKEDLRKHGGITLRTNLDPLKLIWKDRPHIPKSKAEIQPIEFTGKSCREKLADIRKAIRQQHADGMLVAALDDIAWTLNLRGQDVHCNPVLLSYLLITTDDCTLYVNSEKITPEVMAYLKSEGVSTDEYRNIRDGLNHYKEYTILMDPNEINYTLYQIPKHKEYCHVISEKSPIPAMKAIKNSYEIEGFRCAMVRDGVALAKFGHWLDEGIKTSIEQHSDKLIIDGKVQTEISLDEKLTALRAASALPLGGAWRGASFDSIVGFGHHGAIVHYEATPETDIPLGTHGLVLIDSGAQYQDGTTDITRTYALGPLTDEERLVYTLVLKGHIQLELLHFPDGASGTQLDAIARKDLWKHGYNFLHGTGHGVGSYLNVHEGPHQIRMEYRPAPMRAGMTVTDEPGIYVEGKFGVRIENTLIVEKDRETAFGRFLKFDSLTLCPIDTTPIIIDLLTEEEKGWLNTYHQRVYNELSPYLNKEDCTWLKTACTAI